MAGTFCPDWIFNRSVARTAYEFIISDLPIKSYAKKYSSALSEHYSEINPEEMRASALDGTIVDKLVWHEVRASDVFYIPAGTVHAIGGGVSLIEIQQNSDITFRLFDYGRPRDLHLDQAVEVATTGPYPGQLRTRMGNDAGLLVDGPHFRLHHWRAQGSGPLPKLGQAPSLLIPFSGEVSFEGETLGAGDCALASAIHDKSVSGDGLLLIAQARY